MVYVRAVLLFKYLLILLLKMNIVYLYCGQSGAVVSMCVVMA